MNIVEIKENERPVDWKIYPNIEMKMAGIKSGSTIEYIVDCMFLVPVKRRNVKYLFPYRKQYYVESLELLFEKMGDFTSSMLIEVELMMAKAIVPKKIQIDPNSPLTIYKVIK